MPQNAQKAQKCGSNKSPTIVLETSKKLHHTKSIENVKTSKNAKNAQNSENRPFVRIVETIRKA